MIEIEYHINKMNKINLLKDYTSNRLGNRSMDFSIFNLLSFEKAFAYLNY